MCGIVGYVGKKDASPILLDGLKRLEYRGYDSAGLCLISGSDRLSVIKRAGAVANLEQALSEQPSPATCGIAHTRWATHGEPSEINAHPHTNKSQTIAVVHNGIIENHYELKSFLSGHGYKFVSETDTEVIPHLIDHFYSQHGDERRAFIQMVKLIRGSYSIVAVFAARPDTLLAVRQSSPLVVGVGKPGEYIIGSDATPLLALTKKVIYLDDGQIVELGAGGLTILDKNQQPVDPEITQLEDDLEQAQKGNYPHFMLKELNEIPQVIKNAFAGRLKPNTPVKLGGLEAVSQQLKTIRRLTIVACGTSYYAGLTGEYIIEELAGLPVEVQLASEFRYRTEPLSRDTAILAISQSGETADTLEAIRKAKQFGLLTLGVVNAVGSSIARETDAGVYNHAGPELGVASTKAFFSQLCVLYLIALYLSEGRGMNHQQLAGQLLAIDEKLTIIINNSQQIKKIAKKYAGASDMLFIARRYTYPVALEGALKLKELSYLHAEAYAAGEMKHGPLAMIDKKFPTIAIATKNQMQEKVLSNVAEIKARGGPIIAVTGESDKNNKDLFDDVIIVPDVDERLQPFVTALPLQFLAYFIGVIKGHDVDKPRNLAKSVTVE
jgi:glutamine---fructose-6-phosphate transaminase (isomerizing)